MRQFISALPDISRFGAIARARWAEFGNRLREVGLTDRYVASISPHLQLGRETETIIAWHLRRRGDVTASLYRMFCMRDPVTETAAAEALGAGSLSDFLDAGLLCIREPGCIVSNFDLQVTNGLFILCDNLAHGGDAVFGAGPGTFALSRAISGHPHVGDSLDVGCGAGSAALWAARFSHSVLAADINPRAIPFVEVNCAVNGITNVQTRMSDLFEVVGERSFDLIMAQLPFVPNPNAAGSARYRFGGCRGNELALRAISEAPKHLNPGGRCVIVFLQPMDSRSQGPEQGPESDVEARRAEDTSALLLLGPETEADSFSIRYAESEPSGRELGRFEMSVLQMREHLSKNGVSGLCPAVCVLQRMNGARGWTRSFKAAGDLWRDVSAIAINRLLAAEELMQRSENALVQARLRIAQGTLTIEPFVPDSGNKIFVAVPDRMLSKPLEFSRCEWVLLKSVHQACDVESALSSLDVRDRKAALLTISRALCAGVFDVHVTAPS